MNDDGERIIKAARKYIGRPAISEDESFRILHVLCKEMYAGLLEQRARRIEPGAHLVPLRDAVRRGGLRVEGCIGYYFHLMDWKLSLTEAGEAYAKQDDHWAITRRDAESSTAYSAHLKRKIVLIGMSKEEWCALEQSECEHHPSVAHDGRCAFCGKVLS